jgi:molecular chaperone HscB
MQWAAQANEAYRTLKSPLARAAYLCERAGVAIDAESNTSMPGSFLMQQLEWRESLDDARRNDDAAQLDVLIATVTEERDRLIAAIGGAIDVERDHVAASVLVRQLMFIDRFRDEVRAAGEFQSRPREASA